MQQAPGEEEELQAGTLEQQVAVEKELVPVTGEPLAPRSVGRDEGAASGAPGHQREPVDQTPVVLGDGTDCVDVPIQDRTRVYKFRLGNLAWVGTIE